MFQFSRFLCCKRAQQNTRRWMTIPEYQQKRASNKRILQKEVILLTFVSIMFSHYLQDYSIFLLQKYRQKVRLKKVERCSNVFGVYFIKLSYVCAYWTHCKLCRFFYETIFSNLYFIHFSVVWNRNFVSYKRIKLYIVFHSLQISLSKTMRRLQYKLLTSVRFIVAHFDSLQVNVFRGELCLRNVFQFNSKLDKSILKCRVAVW